MEIITVRKLSENITSAAAVYMYLVTGAERAALVDTGPGMSGDLDKVVKSLTDKPAVCLATHCDPDHSGAAALFGDIRMSSKDQVLMDSSSIAKLAHFGTALAAVVYDKERVKYFKKPMVKAEPFTLPLDGQQSVLLRLRFKAKASEPRGQLREVYFLWIVQFITRLS